MTPRYRRDLLGNQIPEVRAAAAIVFDPQTNAVLWEQNGHDQRSIASLTKPITATAVMRLVQEGQVNLTDQLSDFLPVM